MSIHRSRTSVSHDALENSAINLMDLVHKELARDFDKAKEEHGWPDDAKPMWESKWVYNDKKETTT